MILTKELLKAANACTEGYRFVLEGNVVGGDYDAAIAYCKANGQEEYGVWLEENKNTIAVWRSAGKTMLPHSYKCRDEVFLNKQAAEIGAVSAKQKFKKDSKDLFPVVLEQINENGDSTWTPVDIEKTENEGDFQVFNQTTGMHTKVIGKENALAKRNEFLDAYCDEMKWPIEINYIDEQGNTTSDWEIVNEN